MNGELLVARVAGERFAVPAVRIQSVIALDRVVPVPRAPGFVAGLTTLRSRTLTVIDVACSLGLARPEVAARFALVTECARGGFDRERGVRRRAG
jgi:purine-binding chemotaxis protein CheW